MNKLHAECFCCGRHRELCQSHAIPDAIFRPLLRSGSGAAIVLPRGDGRIHRSSDTGKARMFCRECEAHFNRIFDGPLVNLLRLLDKKIETDGFSARVPFDHSELAQALVSVFWRACISPAATYSATKVSARHELILRDLSKGSRDETLRRCSVRFRRLSDSTPENDGGFQQKHISQFLLAPSPYLISSSTKNGHSRLVLDIVIQGFLIHLFVPRLPFRKNSQPGTLRRGQNILHAPPFDLFDYPPLKAALVKGYGKHQEGNVSSGLSK